MEPGDRDERAPVSLRQARTRQQVAIDNEDKDIRGQSGNFSFYAGVHFNAENRCIWAIGWVGEWYVETRRNTEGAFCG